MAFIKISEQPSLYNDLEKKSVRETTTIWKRSLSAKYWMTSIPKTRK